MADAVSRTIRIAAALIDDGDGRLLLVRKAGSPWFMQAGGKIEGQESALAALRRELAEEIGLALRARDATYLGRFSAPAANEPDTIVEAELFHLRVRHVPIVQAEIAEAIWIGIAEAAHLPLAPLTRDVVLPLAETL
ncbi:NUDIX hydrolase [Sphingomonas pituitosa]|uniref:NUDIX hydrolase n=1 Tax=Sphingomonas pituitosa TaxID=99597 RepID=UPI000835D848|nr:NUDIX domain-containing protein [Sphingomonas pituitosa]